MTRPCTCSTDSPRKTRSFSANGFAVETGLRFFSPPPIVTRQCSGTMRTCFGPNAVITGTCHSGPVSISVSAHNWPVWNWQRHFRLYSDGIRI